jgi:SHS2 domain-containing protein
MEPMGPTPMGTTDGQAVLFPHGADIGVRGVGNTRAIAFAQAAAALATAVVDPGIVAATDVIRIVCAAPDDRLLLYDWLNAVIYEMAVRQMVFARFEVSVEGHRLEGRAWGEAIDPGRHAPAVEPKGATMTGLKVEQARDGSWIAECIVDV